MFRNRDLRAKRSAITVKLATSMNSQRVMARYSVHRSADCRGAGPCRKSFARRAYDSDVSIGRTPFRKACDVLRGTISEVCCRCELIRCSQRDRTALCRNVDGRDSRVREVMLALPTIPFKRAVTVVDPGVIAVSTPRNVLPLLTVATEGDEEVHFTAPVTFCVVPSANVPVAVSCSKVCAAMLPLLGSVIFRLTSGDEVTSRVLDPLTLPRAALIVVVPGPLPVAIP